MSGTDLYITLLTTGLAAVAGFAWYLASKWMERVDVSLKEQADNVTRLLIESSKTASVIDGATSQMSKLREEQHLLALDLKKRIKEHVNLGVRSSTDKQIDSIQFDVHYIKATTNQTILPALEEQAASFGRVLDLDRRLTETEKNTRSLYDAVLILAKGRPKA